MHDKNLVTASQFDGNRPFLLNFLVSLHVMAEVAGLSISVQLTQGSPRQRQRDSFRMEDRLHRRRR